jgi:hypothetical protein
MNPRELRQSLGITQFNFWNSIGVTQSGGSRYENGRPMPKPVAILVQLYWVEKYNKKIHQILQEINKGEDHEELLRQI